MRTVFGSKKTELGKEFLIDSIIFDSEKELLIVSINKDNTLKIEELFYIEDGTKLIKSIQYQIKEHQIHIPTTDLQSIVSGKHVLRVKVENIKNLLPLHKALLHGEIKADFTQKLDALISVYLNMYDNVTLNITSKSKRNKTSKHIQGYLDGQFEMINTKQALFEANHGKSNSGNMFALAIELARRENFIIYWASKNVKQAQKMFNYYGFEKIKVIEHLSYEYGRIIATSELVLTDNTFYPFFSKRKGQRYINTWHGTPLKTLGKDIKGEEIEIGNIVSNILQTDILYLPNDYTANHFLTSLDLNGVLKTDVFLAPSARNVAFFNSEQGQIIRENENLIDKKVLVYLPTYRGKSSNADVMSGEVYERLFEDFIAYLPDDYVLYYQLHPIDSQELDISQYQNRVLTIPEYYELYDFLSMTDGLITDYSSVMFDYTLSNKPVYLWTHDKEDYFNDRGTYYELPFPQFEDAKQLIQYIAENPNVTEDLISLKQDFTPYDHRNGAKEIIDHLLTGKSSSQIQKYDAYNGKPNVYIMGGLLWPNGVTSALKNMIDNIDLNERNYILLLDQNNFKKSDIARYSFLADRIKIYPYKGFAIRSDFEDDIVKKYETGEFLTENEMTFLTNAFEREINRIFGKHAPDYFMHFSGYEVKFAEFVIFMKRSKTMMFVHNDMFKEYDTRKNFHKAVIFESYRQSDAIVLVNEELKEKFLGNFPELSEKTIISNNFIGYKNIQKLSDENLEEIILATVLQFSLASQGQGNPLNALKTRLLEGVFDTEDRFSNINHLYDKLSVFIDDIVRRQYLKRIDKNIIREIVTKHYCQQEYFEFKDSFEENFGSSDSCQQLLLELLFPKALEKYRIDILPYATKNQSVLYQMLLDKAPDWINTQLNPIQNIYDIFGLKKLEVLEELNDENIKIFVNIARFDLQKRLDRLIYAFEKVYEKDKQTRLFLVASHGKEKEQILKLVKNSTASRAIRIFGAMDNPYPLLKKCDCFVFTSDYEALGLVVYEALAVGLPVVTTNLSATMKHLSDEHVYPVPLTVEGVYDGMQKFLSKPFPDKAFDFEVYENRTKKEFEEIFYNLKLKQGE